MFTLAYYVLGFSIWTIILNNLGASPKPYMTARAYVCSFLPKYIPGNVAAHGLRTHLAAQAGVPVMVSMKSFVLEAIFALGTAAAVSVPGAVYYRPEVMDPFFNWLVAAVVLVLIVIVAAKRFKLKYIYELDLTAPHRLRAYVKVFLLYLVVWSVSGVAHWCLANALGVYSISNLPKLTVAVSASWALGFISIFAPAGLGVREAVLYFFVKDWMQQAEVILFITLSRLLMFGAEVFLTIGFLLYRRFAYRPDIAITQ